MSGGQRRLSLLANHLNSSRGIATNAASTIANHPSKETFRNRQDYKYYLPIQTRFSDCDMYAHINNSIYYHYFDTIINEYLIKKCGLDTSSDNKTKPIGLVVASQANFYASASYPNLIHAGLSISKIGRSSVTYRVGIFEQENPLACVVGGFTHVFVDPVTRRPVTELPTDFLKGFEQLLVK
ncbi:HotDog domain-containing protein [Parasitella parasitica]|nr:HotDog domain-containing protein [Parasitella parasitica]